MRIDHHAYLRATKVAGFGLLMQIAVGLLLFFFGHLSNDTASVHASLFVFPGVLMWLGLIIIFHQHKLERLEALEEDELSATRAGAESFFERSGEESRVAARRLAMMHKWLMPILSIVIAIALAGIALLILRFMDDVKSGREYNTTEERGWAIAICLAVAVLSFIFSRFVAGMAKQQAWQNLRGGAAYMVGNSLVLVAISAGVIFRYFENESVIRAMGYAIPVLMLVLAAEMVLNFILNLYRPRIPGETPRPAFDSKLLSLFATPDSIVRSLNEAVNYQFGFDVTSSWGYQLLLRSFFWLIGLGVLALVLLSTMVIVEPHQQAVKLRFGRIVDEKVYANGVMWKWPWPFETADVYDVSSMRGLHLTSKVTAQQDRPVQDRVFLWETDAPTTDLPFDPFIVGSPAVSEALPSGNRSSATRSMQAMMPGGQTAFEGADDRSVAAVTDFYSLVDAEITIHYRIRQDQNGLLDYIRFAPDAVARRQELTDRQRALKSIALAEVSKHLAGLSLDQVLSTGGLPMIAELRTKVQQAFDQRKTGVEVLAVNLPILRPSGSAAAAFEELNVSAQVRRQRIAEAQSAVVKRFTTAIGEASVVDEVLAGIDEFDRLRIAHGPTSTEAITQRQKVVDMLIAGGGLAAQDIENAEKDRWSTEMLRRSQASLVQGQLALFRASPELYRQRQTMNVYRRWLPFIDKYVIAIDPSKVQVDMDLKKINPILDFAGASEEELNRK